MKELSFQNRGLNEFLFEDQCYITNFLTYILKVVHSGLSTSPLRNNRFVTEIANAPG